FFAPRCQPAPLQPNTNFATSTPETACHKHTASEGSCGPLGATLRVQLHHQHPLALFQRQLPRKHQWSFSSQSSSTGLRACCFSFYTSNHGVTPAMPANKTLLGGGGAPSLGDASKADRGY
ncbi:hypothetical protein KUCAC02_004943, partial [Chaenocephalus aceratus]